MAKENVLLTNIQQVKKRVSRVISISPEKFKTIVYLENTNYKLLREQEETLTTNVSEVVKNYDMLDISTLTKLITITKQVITKTFQLVDIEVVSNADELQALIDEELEDSEEGDLEDVFTKSRHSRSMLIIALVVMTLVFTNKLRVAAYTFLMFVIIWYLVRVLEHQLFDKVSLPTVKEILPWFCITLAISVMLKKNILDAFKHVVSILNEKSKVFYLILGIQVSQLIIRLSSWSKVLSMTGQKEPVDSINPEDIKDF